MMQKQLVGIKCNNIGKRTTREGWINSNTSVERKDAAVVEIVVLRLGVVSTVIVVGIQWMPVNMMHPMILMLPIGLRMKILMNRSIYRHLVGIREH